MGKEISEKTLKAAEIPPYLRFDVKLIDYGLYEGTIAERFEWVQMILQPFNRALTGSKFEFVGIISNGGYGEKVFKDSSTLLKQIDKTLQIFARCRVYKFYIFSFTYENTSTNVIDAILQFDAIVRCSKIRVEFSLLSSTRTRLPVEAIENWLNLTNANGQEHNERFLKLKIQSDGIPNLGEMFEYLKEVCHCHFCISNLCNVRWKRI